MNAKLRPIRTISRAASVRRSEVASAVKAVIVSRDSSTGRFADERPRDRKLTERSRK
jgi:hypothetical protein